MFDFERVEDFDNHINLSIPNYESLADIFRAFVLEYSSSGGVVADIGCSTGAFLNNLPHRDGVDLQGVDLVDIRKYNTFNFFKGSAHEYLASVDNIDVIISMFSLQFMSKRDRRDTIYQINRHIDNGAVALISEKVFLPTRIDSVLKRQHIQCKRKYFNDKDILDKEADLFGSMQCVGVDTLENEIRQPQRVWQSYNFVGYVCGANP